MSYNYMTYRVPPVSAALKDIDVGFNFLSGSFPANTATSCSASNNYFKAVTGCTTTGTECSTGCNFCESTTAQGVCTVDATAPFNAGTPNAVGAATLLLACVSKCRVLRRKGGGKRVEDAADAGARGWVLLLFPTLPSLATHSLLPPPLPRPPEPVCVCAQPPCVALPRLSCVPATGAVPVCNAS
ncbi:unnamed protein product [Closterium sp. NIES-54]